MELQISALHQSHDDKTIFFSLLWLPLCFKIKKFSVDQTNSKEQITARRAESSQPIVKYPQTNARNFNVSGSKFPAAF
jgi:hypothetical protein